MEDVIDLSSDSDGAAPFETGLSKSIENHISIKKSCLSDDDFDFPEVPFAREAAKQIYSASEPPFEKKLRRSSCNIEEKLLAKYMSEKVASESITVKKTNKNGFKNNDNNNAKELLKIQKLKAAEEAARKKAEKAEFAKLLKSMKPGECMKYIKVTIDSDLQDLRFFNNLITELQSFELQYRLESQTIPYSITWKRTRKENSDTAAKFPARQSFDEENQILIIWDYAEAAKKVSDDTFVASIVNMADLIPGKSVTLVIYGMKDYSKSNKNLQKKQPKNQRGGNDKDGNKRGSKTPRDVPAISKKQLELCLAEIHLRMNCNSYFVETPEQLGLLINQYTKAIAEAPFKIRQREAKESELDWYSAADNKDTVRVDKNGNGLNRLWQQQLCQFDLAKLETAEAIISQYPTPVRLMEAYDNSTSSDGEKLLQDIAIRRTAGPLTAIRKIGPELSKKLYLMFTAEDGDVLLGNESLNL